MNKYGGDSYCILGALRISSSQHNVNLALNPIGQAVLRSLLLALGEPNGISPEPIVNFNDARSRRKHEVLSLMDRAIEHLP